MGVKVGGRYSQHGRERGGLGVTCKVVLVVVGVVGRG